MANSYVLANEGVRTAINRLAGTSGWDIPKYIGWGTGSSSAAATDTTLSTESAEDRVSGTVSVETDTLTDDTYQVVGTLTSESSQTITNAGVFDTDDTTDANDKLFMKGSFTGIGVDSGDAIQFTFRWRINNS
jgi:hypothetical protein